MKSLIAELLVRLAEKEEESKELVTQVEALEIVVTAILRKLEVGQLQQITDNISQAMQSASDSQNVNSHDSSMLNNYIQRLLTHPRN